MTHFFANPLFGVMLSVGAYYLGTVLFKRTNGFFLFAPLFVAMVIGVIFLLVTGISYEDYQQGGQIINFFLEPATIMFAIPLYKKRDVLQKYWLQILGGITTGSILSIVAIYAACQLLRLDDAVIASMLPQAATTAIAMSTSVGIGGSAELTSLACILNGVIVYSLARPLLKLFHIKNDIAAGVGLGTAGHALGTSAATKIGPVEGSMASIAFVITGVIVAVIVPVFNAIVK